MARASPSVRGRTSGDLDHRPFIHSTGGLANALRPSGLGRHQRQPNCEAGAVAGLVSGFYRAALIGDDGGDDAETESAATAPTSPGRIDAIEAIKDLLFCAVGETRALVDNVDDRLSPSDWKRTRTGAPCGVCILALASRFAMTWLSFWSSPHQRINLRRRSDT